MVSPCTGRCALKNNVCVGCGRTLDEIKNWSVFSASQRDAVMKKLASNKQAGEHALGHKNV